MTLEEAITQGGDQRIERKSNGLNKYLVNPTTSKGHFNRGSCTCSPLSTDVRKKVNAVFKQLQNGDSSVEDIRIKQRFRSKALLQDADTNDFNIFFAPSGTDLCFYPLLFSKIKEPSKPILSLITCPEELGTGSILANTGHFFSEKTQLTSDVPYETQVNPLTSVEHKLFPARDEQGAIIDHKEEIYQVIEEHKDTHHIIVNLVIGSKSGIEDNISIIEDGPKDVTWVVDLCQMRAAPQLFNQLLKLNCLLMITGSKFYQSPPFCGALLVPETYAADFVEKPVPAEVCEGYNKVYSKLDIPPCYKELRKHFTAFENIGLTLRWEAAISESELLANFSEREVTYAISQWNRKIKEYLESKEMFKIMTDQDLTNRSIIAFNIQIDGKNLNQDELRAIYEELCLNGKAYNKKYDRYSIGQPVAYEKYSFLRLALGSKNIRDLIASDLDFSDDFKIIDMVEEITCKLHGTA